MLNITAERASKHNWRLTSIFVRNSNIDYDTWHSLIASFHSHTMNTCTLCARFWSETPKASQYYQFHHQTQMVECCRIWSWEMKEFTWREGRRGGTEHNPFWRKGQRDWRGRKLAHRRLRLEANGDVSVSMKLWPRVAMPFGDGNCCGFIRFDFLVPWLFWTQEKARNWHSFLGWK